MTLNDYARLVAVKPCLGFKTTNIFGNENNSIANFLFKQSKLQTNC